MTTQNNDDDGIFDEQGIHVVDHIVIRDVDTLEVLVNQRGSTPNLNRGDSNEE
jgi:hypothetical protein